MPYYLENVKLMIIKKVFIYLIVSVSVLTIAGSAMAVTLENPLAGGGVHDFPTLLIRIAWGVGTLIASLGTIMIIIAGIQYMTSAGNEERAAKAKKTILYTLIGVAIVVAVDFIIGLIGEIVGKK